MVNSLISSLGVVTLATLGCMPPQTGYDAQRDNPLGPSFWIVATPSSDDGLLGRAFARPPDAALTLEEQSTPNPCAAKLSPKRESQMPNHYESAIATRDRATGGVTLASYGFAADASVATHLLYKVTTSSRVSQLDTTEYQACCQERDCGWGYVQSLVLGHGEYAAGIEASAAAGGNYQIVTGRAARSFQVTNRRAISGYLAAVIVAHDRRQAVQACAAGYEWASFECVPKGWMAQQESRCRHGRPEQQDPFWAGSEGMLTMFWKDQVEACEQLASHGGPRIAPPPAPKAEPRPRATAP